MGILKKRSFAAIVLVLVILVFTPIGVSMAMSSFADRAENVFYGEKDINYQLENRYKNAVLMVSTTNVIPDLAQQTNNLRAAADALYDAQTIKDKNSANIGLQDAVDKLYSAAINSSAFNSDPQRLEDLNYYRNIIDNAQWVINSSEYNTVVDEYYQARSTFPANLFGVFISDKNAPVYFNS